MERSRRVKLVWCWSLAAAGLTALFWGIWYLAAGEVPEVTYYRWDLWTHLTLPFAVSRLWDILFVGIWTALIVLAVTDRRVGFERPVGACLGISMYIGLVVLGVALGYEPWGDSAEAVPVVAIVGSALGLAAGLAAAKHYGLGVAGIVFGPVLGLAVGLSTLHLIHGHGLGEPLALTMFIALGGVGLGFLVTGGLEGGLCFYIGIGLGGGMIVGFIAGLVAGLAVGLANGLIAGLIALIRLLYIRKTRSAADR